MSSAVVTSFWRALQLCVEQPPYHTVMHWVMMLPVVPQEKPSRVFRVQSKLLRLPHSTRTFYPQHFQQSTLDFHPSILNTQIATLTIYAPHSTLNTLHLTLDSQHPVLGNQLSTLYTSLCSLPSRTLNSITSPVNIWHVTVHTEISTPHYTLNLQHSAVDAALDLAHSVLTTLDSQHSTLEGWSW